MHEHITAEHEIEFAKVGVQLEHRAFDPLDGRAQCALRELETGLLGRVQRGLDPRAPARRPIEIVHRGQVGGNHLVSAPTLHLERPEPVHRADVEASHPAQVRRDGIPVQDGPVVEHRRRDDPTGELQRVIPRVTLDLGP